MFHSEGDWSMCVPSLGWTLNWTSRRTPTSKMSILGSNPDISRGQWNAFLTSFSWNLIPPFLLEAGAAFWHLSSTSDAILSGTMMVAKFSNIWSWFHLTAPSSGLHVTLWVWYTYTRHRMWLAKGKFRGLSWRERDGGHMLDMRNVSRKWLLCQNPEVKLF